MRLVDKLEEGLRILETGPYKAFEEYADQLRAEDALAFEVLDFYAAVLRSQAPETLRKGRKLLAHIRDEPEIIGRVYGMLGLAYRRSGEMEIAENCYLKALDMAECIVDQELWSYAKLSLVSLKFFKAEYTALHEEIAKVLHRLTPSKRARARYLLAIINVIAGKPERAVDTLNSLIRTERDNRHLSALLEAKGFALRVLGELERAMDLYTESAQSYSEIGSAYSAFPCAKALEIARFAGLNPPPEELVEKCLTLAKRGAISELAALAEIKALMAEDDNEISDGLLKAAKDYLYAYHPIEAFMTGLASAFLAWRQGGAVFHEAMRFLVPLAPQHRGIKRDPILGPFLGAIEPLLSYEITQESQSGIRAYLISETRIFVDQKEVHLNEWRNKRAARIFIYMLLSPKHGLPYDYLFYLVWPRRKYNEKSRELLYTAMVAIRRNLGRPGIVLKKGDFYQLDGDVWTDLSELESLVRKADASQDPDEKEELLARARQLAQGELLPEFPYDKHIEEYRQYYNRLRKRLFGE